MPKLKICHFSSVHSLTDTRVFHRECISLAKYFEVVFIGIGKFNGIKNNVRLKGISKPKSFFIRYFYTVFKVFIEAVKTDANLYHIHDAEMIPFGVVLSLSGKKVIYDIHENTYADIKLKPWLNPFFKLVFAYLYNLTLRIGTHFMHYIVVIAEKRFLKDFFVKEGQYTIIQNYADVHSLKHFRVQNRALLSENNLFYIGMIKDMYYNIEVLLEAIYVLKMKGLILKLHCIGYFGVQTESDLSKFKNWDAIKEQIIFYGFLEMNEAYKISESCKVGICLKNQPEEILVSHERKLFEYMAIGLPSIFCNSHIYRELNDKFEIGIDLNLNNATELASGIEALLNDNKLLQKLSENNLQAASINFDWKFEEQKLLMLYQNLSKSVN